MVVMPKTRSSTGMKHRGLHLTRELQEYLSAPFLVYQYDGAFKETRKRIDANKLDYSRFTGNLRLAI